MNDTYPIAATIAVIGAILLACSGCGLGPIGILAALCCAVGYVGLMLGEFVRSRKK